jgi:hypothetical protein
MSDKEQEDSDDVSSTDNAYVNQITLNFLISKSQLHKLNKLKQKDVSLEPTYDKDRIHNLFNQLLNNDKPNDLLEDVKDCFDAFIEKSIYYLEIHDKNESIQKERRNDEECNQIIDQDEDKDEYEDQDEDQYQDEDQDNNSNSNSNSNDHDDDDEPDEKPLEEYFEEPIKNITAKYPKKSVSNGVEDIHKLPLDWFNTTRQNYKKNQILPRKKEIIIENSSSKKIIL